MKILVINAGSSSLKYQLFDMANEYVMAKGICDRIGIDGSIVKHTPGEGEQVSFEKPMKNHADAIAALVSALTDPEIGVIADMTEIQAIGHRVVHGGEEFSGSVLITEEVKATLLKCSELAPLHNPPNLIGINACEEIMPGVPQVGVFDTAFHQTMQPSSYMYAIPYEMYEKHKIRKYGFHGTSHKYVSQRAAEMLGKPIEELKIITLHLGNGSSVAAVKNGVSIDTSMGFTPLPGLVMGTRSGDIDPAIVRFLMQKENLTVDEVDTMLNKQSGVFGISGVSSDFRDLEKASNEGNERATLALEMFVASVKRYVGSYAMIMGGVDAIVFTAGIGENTAPIREAVMANTEFLGAGIDTAKNAVRGVEADISADGAKVRTLVIPTNEELMIAKDTAELVK